MFEKGDTCNLGEMDALGDPQGRGMSDYGLWASRGSSLEYAFTRADLESYQEELEWLDFATSLDIDSPTFAKVVEVRHWTPWGLV